MKPANAVKQLGDPEFDLGTSDVTVEQIISEARIFAQANEQRIAAHKKRQYRTNTDDIATANTRFKFEEQLRRHPRSRRVYTLYAHFELNSGNLTHARTVWERALQHLYDDPLVWTQYIKMELKLQNFNSVRNLYDRVTKLLPLDANFWNQYLAFATKHGDPEEKRKIFEAWLSYKPELSVFLQFIDLEFENGGWKPAKIAMARTVNTLETCESFVSLAKWALQHNAPKMAKYWFERCVEVLPPHDLSPQFFVEYAKYCELYTSNSDAETVFARGISLLAHHPELHILKDEYLTYVRRSKTLFHQEYEILTKRCQKYQLTIAKFPYDYVTRFALADARFTQYSLSVANVKDSLPDNIAEEDSSVLATEIKEFFDDCIQHHPQEITKTAWKPFMYICYAFLAFFECVLQDSQLCEDVFQHLIKLLKSKALTFAKFWVYYAEFTFRNGTVNEARAVFNHGQTACPSTRLIRSYAQFELLLGNVGRAKSIVANFVKMQPHNYKAWQELIKLETNYGDADRVVKIFDTVIDKQLVVSDSKLWEDYLKFMISNFDANKVCDAVVQRASQMDSPKQLSRLLNLVSQSLLELSQQRVVFKELTDLFPATHKFAENRYTVLQAWLELEKAYGDKTRILEIESMMPEICYHNNEDGSVRAEYMFNANSNETDSKLNIIAAARSWLKTAGTREN